MLTSRRTLLLGLTSLGLAPFAFAQSATVREVEAALESIRSVRGRFLQIAHDGAVTRGDYSLLRPGRLRFEYDNSNDIVLSDGTWLMEANTRTGSRQRRRLSATPLNTLLADDVDLSSDVTLTRVEDIAGSRRVTLHRTGRREEGNITLIFNAETLQLEAWQVVEGNGERTTVRLESMEVADSFPRSTFEAPER